MTITPYTNTNTGIDFHHIRNRDNERYTKKGKMSNNKSNECHTRFDDIYRLYKYNIGIDYHHIRNRNEQSYTKKEKLKNKSSECNTRFDVTYRLYKYNIGGIQYHHIRNRNKEKNKQGKS